MEVINLVDMVIYLGNNEFLLSINDRLFDLKSS